MLFGKFGLLSLAPLLRVKMFARQQCQIPPAVAAQLAQLAQFASVFHPTQVVGAATSCRGKGADHRATQRQFELGAFLEPARNPPTLCGAHIRYWGVDKKRKRQRMKIAQVNVLGSMR